MFNCIETFTHTGLFMTFSELPNLLRRSLVNKFPRLLETNDIEVNVIRLPKSNINSPDIRLELKRNSKAYVDYSKLKLSSFKFDGIDKSQQRTGFLVNYLNERYDLDLTIDDIEVSDGVVRSRKDSLVVQGAAKL